MTTRLTKPVSRETGSVIFSKGHRALVVTLHDTFYEAELGGQHVAAVHFPELGKALAAGGRYDVVFYGHNHQQATEHVGKTWLVNPGEVMGRFGRSTYVVYDTESGQVDVRQV